MRATRIARALLRLFSRCFVIILAVQCLPLASKELPFSDRCSLTREEHSFGRTARGIDTLLRDKRITCKDFRAIHRAHKLWEEDRRIVQRRPYNVVGTDAKSIEKRLREERHLNGADLRGFDMAWADLTGAHLNGANISGTGIRAELAPGTAKGYLHGIDLTNARLIGAQFGDALAKKTLLRLSLLIGADFRDTDLSGAVLYGSDLRWATFKNSVLTDADFSGSNLQGVIFEPRAGMLPNIGRIASARNLEKMTFRANPHQLSELRAAFFEAELTDQAQRITYAIQRTKRINDLNGESVRQFLGILRLVAFEWTVGYGMHPFRPLLIVLFLIPAFALAYFVALAKRGPNRIWISRSVGSVSYNQNVRWFPLEKLIRGNPFHRHWSYLRVAMWFSLMSAFRVGFREVDVGQWLMRLQPRQYSLEARGWCRSVAGVQSLLSVYLLALSILCIVGRPFG